ncbi:rh115.1 [macacine betaherpesvirus 3]|uniref:Rh115.1 n=1 Tax=Rhesus cytomegalovirus (strain 68-1) TaxID=47929 RepID=Q2FAJ7_RHCM6|nr:rh115.1 [macacine betaherpesvirus 3]
MPAVRPFPQNVPPDPHLPPLLRAVPGTLYSTQPPRTEHASHHLAPTDLAGNQRHRRQHAHPQKHRTRATVLYLLQTQPQSRPAFRLGQPGQVVTARHAAPSFPLRRLIQPTGPSPHARL